MTFGHPWLLLSLLALPLLGLLYVRMQRRRVRYAVRFTNLDVLASVAPARSWRRAVVPALLTAALAALCVGLARPHRHALVPAQEATVILVLDVSRSMESHDIKPTRLGAARAAIQLFLKRVPKQVRVGLILFAGDASVGAVPSTDRSQVRQALDYAESYSAFGGTAIGDALQRAVELARQSVPGLPTSTGQTIAYVKGKQTSPVTILFLSDGHQTRGVLQPLQGADLAKAAGIPVNTIALGTPNGTLDQSQLGPFGGPNNPYGAGPFNVAPDPKTLHAIANDTGGKFFSAQSEKAVRSAYSNLSSLIGRKAVQQEITSRFVLLAALLLLAAGIVSRPWAPRLP